MKKKTKKLELAKETVRNLGDGLRSVQGGKPPIITVDTACSGGCETTNYCEPTGGFTCG